MIVASDLAREARDLLNAARANEARRRTVVSRAYYAGYHHVRSMAAEAGWRFNRQEGKGIHQHLIGWLSDHSDGGMRHVGSLMQSLLLVRRLADYQLEQSVTWEQAVDAVERAEELLADYGEED